MGESGVSLLILGGCLSRESISDGPRQAAINVILTRLICMVWGEGVHPATRMTAMASLRMYKLFFFPVLLLVSSPQRGIPLSRKLTTYAIQELQLQTLDQFIGIATSTINHMGLGRASTRVSY